MTVIDTDGEAGTGSRRAPRTPAQRPPVPLAPLVATPDDDAGPAAAGIPDGTAGRLPAGEPAEILLAAEGAYPFHAGGVSVWCDQLIRGLPEHRFRVAALSVSGAEQSLWPPPDNLAEVISIPLWGPRRRARRAFRRPPRSFTGAHESFLWALTRPDHWAADGRRAFLTGLRGMFDYAQQADLGAALMSNAALKRLMDMWQAGRTGADRAGAHAGAGPSLADALEAASLLEHMLRPLSAPPVRADICHLAMNGLSALVGMASKWAHGSKLVMSEHGVYLRERYLAMMSDPGRHAVKVLLLRFFRELAGAAYQTADIMAPHSSYNRRWQLHDGVSADRMRTMYNGVDPADFPQAEDEPEHPTVVFMGRCDPIKDLHTLIRAFALVRERVPDARLRMFGPVPATAERYHAGCLALIDELGLTGAAVFEGKVPRQIDAYHAGHLVALTSISEGFPYTVVESMACGRPPVCTNVGGVAEAVGDAGFVVPPRDPAAVADACVRLLTDRPLRWRLGAAARQRVLSNFTLARSLDAYRAIYSDLLYPADAPILDAPEPVPAPGSPA